MGIHYLKASGEGGSGAIRAGPAAAATTAAAAAAAAAAAPPPARPPAREAPVPASAGRGACAPLRPCGGAARPAERCGATSSAELEETSALLAVKASHGAVTSSARRCARALALIFRGHFSSRETVLWTRCRPARLWRRLVSAAVCCWRRQHGSVAWQVPGRPGSPCSALPPPKSAVPDTGQFQSQLENKVRPGRSAGKMSKATFCLALGFTEPKAGAFPLQANGYMTQICPRSPTCIPSGSLNERVQQHTES
ncbi:uncharacterized protein LOC120323932 [Pipra filicauda]|uniref:Uncharacterized protein LOC120323932 n=1 Tax=Pipra filicauda TaxID=649802 RepID=A0A7R5KW22_9PASS|nr:uncharacterized protein LOC120323932 [Pipra filicauda]